MLQVDGLRAWQTILLVFLLIVAAVGVAIVYKDHGPKVQVLAILSMIIVVIGLVLGAYFSGREVSRVQVEKKALDLQADTGVDLERLHAEVQWWLQGYGRTANEPPAIQPSSPPWLFLLVGGFEILFFFLLVIWMDQVHRERMRELERRDAAAVAGAAGRAASARAPAAVALPREALPATMPSADDEDKG